MCSVNTNVNGPPIKVKDVNELVLSLGAITDVKQLRILKILSSKSFSEEELSRMLNNEDLTLNIALLLSAGLVSVKKSGKKGYKLELTNKGKSFLDYLDNLASKSYRNRRKTKTRRKKGEKVTRFIENRINFPLEPIVKILKEAGAERVTRSAEERMRYYVIKYGIELAKLSVEIAHHSGRKTVTGDDIELAARSMRTKLGR